MSKARINELNIMNKRIHNLMSIYAFNNETCNSKRSALSEVIRIIIDRRKELKERMIKNETNR